MRVTQETQLLVNSYWLLVNRRVKLGQTFFKGNGFELVGIFSDGLSGSTRIALEHKRSIMRPREDVGDKAASTHSQRVS